MSFQAMTWAVEQDLRTAEKMVLIMLSNCCNGHTGQCNPSHKRLAQECGMSLSTLKRCIEKLSAGGFLVIQHRTKEGVSLPNQYHLNIGFSVDKNVSEIASTGGGSVHSELGVGSYRPDGSVHSELGVGSQRPTNQEYNQEYKQEYKPSDADKSAPVLESAVVVFKKPEQSNAETAFQEKCRHFWTAYKTAYLVRYKTNPVRNAKVNSQVKQIMQRLGSESASVVEFYVLNINDAFVLRSMHDLGTLLSKAEAYRTQWATGQAMTNTRAQQMDSTQTNQNSAHEAIAMLRARTGG